MAKFESIKFENYERELKYLISEGTSATLTSLLNLFIENGYCITDMITKEKREVYYDDSQYSLIKSGEVMRASNYVSELATGLMYKRNVSDSLKPYVSKIEMGSTTYKELPDFVKLFNLQLTSQIEPIMKARMTREVAIIEKGNDKLYVSFDKVFYSTLTSAEVYEEMLEIEDWKVPNTMNVDHEYENHLLEANRIISDSLLPLVLTKDSKPYRGYILLRKNGIIT